MRELSFLIAFLLAMVIGCSSHESERGEYAWGSAERHMDLAEKLERAASLREATFEYTLVAQLFPSSESYPVAVRKAALLYANPKNPAKNDSAARYWFQKYLELDLTPEERDLAVQFSHMTQTTTLLEAAAARRGGTADSLHAVVKKQTTDLAAKSKRVQELEAELIKVSQELKKLREIDVRMHKDRQKKK